MRTDAQGAAGRAGRMAVLGLVLALTGCSAFVEQEIPPPCPEVSVLRDASAVTRFRADGGTDLVDVLHEGEITGLSYACAYDVDDETGEGTVEMEIYLRFDATRGAADRTRTAEFTYFLALTGGERDVLEKKLFDAGVEFPGNISRVSVQNGPIPMSLPVSPQISATSYEVFIGFQLTPEEMAYNREQGTGRSTGGLGR